MEIFIELTCFCKKRTKTVSKDIKARLDFFQWMAVEWTPPFIFCLRRLNLQFRSAVAQFKMINKGIVLFLRKQFVKKNHVKPHIYYFCVFWQQFRSVFVINKSAKEVFTFWSTSVQDSRTTPSMFIFFIIM